MHAQPDPTHGHEHRHRPHTDGHRPPQQPALRVERHDERQHSPTRRRRQRMTARKRVALAPHHAVADRPIAAHELLEGPLGERSGQGDDDDRNRQARAAARGDDGRHRRHGQHDTRRTEKRHTTEHGVETRGPGVDDPTGDRLIPHEPPSHRAESKRPEHDGRRRKDPAPLRTGPRHRHRRVEVQVGHDLRLKRALPTTTAKRTIWGAHVAPRR